MFTPQLKCSDLSLEPYRVYTRSPTPNSASESSVALKKIVWVISELLNTEIVYLDSLRDVKEVSF